MSQTYFVQNNGGKSNPFVAALIGILMFLGSFVLVYKNEGRINLAVFAQKAAPLVEGGTYTDGQLVALTGPVMTDETIGDKLFKKPEQYVSLRREVEMYAWKEEKHDKDNGTEYTYNEEWTSSPSDSSSFEIKTGHENPVMPFKSETFTANKLTIGQVAFNGVELSLPSHKGNVALTKSNVDLLQKYGKAAIVNGDSQIYIKVKDVKTTDEAGDSTNAAPTIGDLRVTYHSIPVESQVTVFGAYKSGSPQSITSYTATQSLKDSTTFYHMRYGTQAAATETLGNEFKFMLWALRVLGFILMLVGFNMILSPIKTLLGYIPIVGQIGNFALGAISFVVVLALYAVTLFVAIVAHNPVVLAIAAVVIIIIGAFVAKKFGTKKVEDVSAASRPIESVGGAGIISVPPANNPPQA